MSKQIRSEESDHIEGQRTAIDFSKHGLEITRDTLSTIYNLQKEGSSHHRITIIVSNGVTTVTGDFRNWLFSAEFNAKSFSKIDDVYWSRKLEHQTMQNAHCYSASETAKELENRMHNLRIDHADTYKVAMLKNFYLKCKEYVGNEEELELCIEKYNPYPHEVEGIKKDGLHYQLQCVLDGMQEIINRLKK
jgi:hypothetical protein